MKDFAPVIIILNYNGTQDTLACLESLQAATLGEASIILVENGSAAEAKEELLNWNEQVKLFTCIEHLTTADAPTFSQAALATTEPTLLLSPANLGFAGGNNLATRLAIDRGREEVLLLNNDTTVAADFLHHLAKARQQYPQAVLTPQIRRHATPDLIWNCGGDLLWPGRKKYHYADAPIDQLPDAAALRISFVTGCALLYQPARTGYLTEDFFFGEEDMELSLRLLKKGIPLYCILPSVVYHKIGSSLSSNARKSEIFTLKRLVNLRKQLNGLSFFFAFGYYLTNLLRLFLFHYRVAMPHALTRTIRIGRRSLSLTKVGKDLCIDYVRNGQPAP